MEVEFCPGTRKEAQRTKNVLVSKLAGSLGESYLCRKNEMLWPRRIETRNETSNTNAYSGIHLSFLSSRNEQETNLKSAMILQRERLQESGAPDLSIMWVCSGWETGALALGSKIVVCTGKKRQIR